MVDEEMKELTCRAVAAVPETAAMAGLKADVSASSAASWIPEMIFKSAAETPARSVWSTDAKRAVRRS